MNTSTTESFGIGTVDIAQMQVVLGDQPAPFVPSSIGEELERCKRYYQTIYVSVGGYRSPGAWTLDSVPYPVEMRITPTTNWAGTPGKFNLASDPVLNPTAKNLRVTINVAEIGIGFAQGTVSLDSEL